MSIILFQNPILVFKLEVKRIKREFHNVQLQIHEKKLADIWVSMVPENVQKYRHNSKKFSLLCAFKVSDDSSFIYERN